MRREWTTCQGDIDRVETANREELVLERWNESIAYQITLLDIPPS
jgi:hypothetical protein